MAAINDWDVPDNPDPLEVMHSGLQDAMDGRHEVALAKFLWFHENALSFDQALIGVRLSFALSYWHQLANDYPPAMTALQETRNQAERSFLSAGYRFQDFHDLSSLNRELGTPTRTAEVFKQVTHRDINAAHQVYHIAEPALVAEKEFSLCNTFLEPEKRLDVALRGFRVARRFETSNFGSGRRPPEIAFKHLVQNLSVLIALLVINNRASEAQAVADRAQAALPDYQVLPELESALAGHVPPAWP